MSLIAISLLALLPQATTVDENEEHVRLWPGAFAAEARVHCQELGVSFRVPKGWTGQYELGDPCARLDSDDGRLAGEVWFMGGYERAPFDAWLAAKRKDRKGRELKADAPARGEDGLLSTWYASDESKGLLLVHIDSKGAAEGAWITGPASDAKRIEKTARRILKSFQRYRPSTQTEGLYGWLWLERMRGKRVSMPASFTAGGEPWRLDLCFDGTWRQFDGEAAQGPFAGSANRGILVGNWRLEANERDKAMVICSARGGSPLRYLFQYDPEKGEYYIAGLPYDVTESPVGPRPTSAPPMILMRSDPVLPEDWTVDEVKGVGEGGGARD